MEQYNYELINRETLYVPMELSDYIQFAIKTVNHRLNFQDNNLINLIRNNDIEPQLLCKIMMPMSHAINFLEPYLEKYKSYLIGKSTALNQNYISPGIRVECLKTFNQTVEDYYSELPFMYTDFMMMLDTNCECYDDNIKITRPVKIFIEELNRLLEQKNLAFNSSLIGSIKFFFTKITEYIVQYADTCNVMSYGSYRIDFNETKDFIIFCIIANFCGGSKENINDGIATAYTLINNMFQDLLEDYLYKNQ